jgi:hypothetical protein
MSTSPIRQVFETAAPNDLVNIQRPTAGGFTAIDASVPLASMLESGSYTPTISGVVNGILVTPNSATFIKVGSIATVSIQLSILLDTLQDTGAFELSLPVASNFTSPKQLFGLMQYSFGPGTLAEIILLDIRAETTNNTCFVNLQTLTQEIAMDYCTLQFQYEIV